MTRQYGVMTSNSPDDIIEVLSIHPDLSSSHCINLVTTPVDDNVCVLPPGDDDDEDEKQTKHQKRVARVVMVIASTMLLMSVLLVTVTLYMSDHIDEMVRQKNGFTTSVPYHAAAAKHQFTTPAPSSTINLIYNHTLDGFEQSGSTV